MTARWAWRLDPTMAWASVAIVVGLALAVLPVRWAGVAVAGLLILSLALWRPMFAIVCAVGLGITKAYLARLGYGGFLFDLGQIFTGIALAGWAARKLLRRDLSFQAPALLIPLALFALVGAASLLDATSYADGLPELIKWLQIMAIVVVVVDEASEIDWRWLVVGLCALAVVQGGLGLVQYLGRGASLGFPPDLLESFRIGPDRFRAFGTFEQPNPYAGFVGLVWPIAAGAALGLLAEIAKRRGWRAATSARPAEWTQLALFMAAAGLGLAGLYGSVSRGGWIGAAGAAAVMAVLLPRRWGWSLSAVVGVAAVAGLAWSLNLVPANIAARLASATDFIGVQDVRGVTISNDNFAVVERLAHWQAAFSMIDDRPWLGVGLGNYAAAYDRYRLVNWPNALGHAHNIYLNVWAETGLFGLVTYFALWGSVVWITLRGLRLSAGLERGVLLGLMGAWTHLSLHQLFDNLYVNNMHLLLAALLGLLAYVYGKQRTTP